MNKGPYVNVEDNEYPVAHKIVEVTGKWPSHYESISDYAFKNDSLARTNDYKQKNCQMTKKYSNIFKDSNTWEIKCQGDYLNSYYIGD